MSFSSVQDVPKMPPPPPAPLIVFIELPGEL